MACTICGKDGHNRRTCPERKMGNVKPKRSKGAQPGNTNALKHGLYSPRFTVGEVAILDEVENKLDVSHEIDLLRVMISRVMDYVGAKQDGGIEVIDLEEVVPLLNAISRASERIGHLVRVQFVVFGEGGSIEDALQEALSDVAEEMGLV